MCGIFCRISRKPDRTDEILPSSTLADSLHCRGPDSTGQHEHRSPDSEPAYVVSFRSTVLSLRGDVVTRQPFRQPGAQCTLCWNGEAWSIAGKPTYGNDTQVVFSLLKETITSAPNVFSSHRQEVALNKASILADHLSQVAGPYAYVFHDERSHIVYLGRDFLGRRSLLTRRDDSGCVTISSISDGRSTAGWNEVAADGVYYIDLLEDDFPLRKVPYRYIGDDHAVDKLTSVIPRLTLNKTIPTSPSSLDPHSPSVSKIKELLKSSLRPRVLNIPDPPQPPTTSHQPARLAILFSGGLDCTLLARLTHDILPTTEPIDLLNIAFENPRIHNPTTTPDIYETCPDRVTGRASFAELSNTRPTRPWRFLAINVPYPEFQSHRQTIIRLMHPHNTEMDLSICAALYFASRGTGTLHPPSSTPCPQYTTPARVLLSGLGADELFAGYTRHATAFDRRGYEGLLEELDLDIVRLGQRNLGRDDRVMGGWGREVRFPFLDEGVVGWALHEGVEGKCGFGGRSGGDGGEEGALEDGKKILRCLAWSLGMRGVARERKRAIQFGARTAKMESGKTKGTHVLEA